jgi:hypothetical protein
VSSQQGLGALTLRSLAPAQYAAYPYVCHRYLRLLEDDVEGSRSRMLVSAVGANRQVGRAQFGVVGCQVTLECCAADVN